MIRLGVNSVLFKTVSFREAAEAIKKCGYDGVEISAIPGMNPHLVLPDEAAIEKSIHILFPHKCRQMLTAFGALQLKHRIFLYLLTYTLLQLLNRELEKLYCLNLKRRKFLCLLEF